MPLTGNELVPLLFPGQGFDGLKTTLEIATMAGIDASARVPLSLPCFASNSSVLASAIASLTGLTGNEKVPIVLPSSAVNSECTTADIAALAPYVASAVHWNSTSWLYNAGLTISNSRYLFSSQWIKPDPTWPNGGGNLFDFNPINFEIVLGININTGLVTSMTPDGSNNLQFLGHVNLFDGNWHNVLFSGNSQAGTVQVYVDDIVVAMTNIAGTPGFDMPFSGLDVAVPDNKDQGFLSPMLGDMSDVFLAPGLNVDLSVTANRRLFIDSSGKPVKPSKAITALGNPAILFNGNATAFQINQGTGGTFALTGTLTNAATHP